MIFTTPSRLLAGLALLLWLPWLALPSHAGKAHEHGAARLDIAYEAGKLGIDLATPLDGILGFERAPRSDAERQGAAAAVATLKAGATLFAIDPAAGCALSAVELVSAPLQLGGAAAKADEHGDLDGHWEFNCKAAPAWIDVGLFAAFKRLSRIDVQTATPKGQARVTLKPPSRRVLLKS
jgi:hypothetical protein